MRGSLDDFLMNDGDMWALSPMASDLLRQVRLGLRRNPISV